MHTRSKEGTSAVAVFSCRATPLKAWISAVRPHQWSKNVLIFMPLLLSHQFQPWRLLASLQAFLAFSCCASMFYVLNDLLDREADRMHTRKAKRPFASGDLNTEQGLLLLVACVAPTIALAWSLPFSARIVLLLYAATNLGYSVRLKQVVFLDVLVLTLFYSFRLLFGGAAEHIDVSYWTLAFSAFLFLGLALIKRWTELLSMSECNGVRLARRGYLLSDMSTVRSFAEWSLYLSVVVLALYINSMAASKLYRHPQVLWLVCLLLFVWVRRVTVVTNKGLMTDDPVLFAFKDNGSQAIALLVAVSGALAIGL
ncbi:MAG: UbiA family prenyltransferase [Bryobacteraceae bacterium]